MEFKNLTDKLCDYTLRISITENEEFSFLKTYLGTKLSKADDKLEYQDFIDVFLVNTQLIGILKKQKGIIWKMKGLVHNTNLTILI